MPSIDTYVAQTYIMDYRFQRDRSLWSSEQGEIDACMEVVEQKEGENGEEVLEEEQVEAVYKAGRVSEAVQRGMVTRSWCWLGCVHYSVRFFLTSWHTNCGVGMLFCYLL